MSHDTTDTPVSAKPMIPLRFLRLAALGLVTLILLAGIVAYAITPAAIRKPAFQHYHWRVQIIANGKAVDFSQPAFQEGYSKDNCNANLTLHPFHFHDHRDQLAHVHWNNMTGGLFLKYYGWNYIGGLHNSLGFRFDQLPKLPSVPIHGNVLPKLANGDTLFVYSGDEHHFTLRNTDDFLHKDFETFFGKQSNLGHGDKVTRGATLLDKLFPKAYAHGTETHDDHGTDANTTPSDVNLEEVNNLLGNVVIFAQKDKPTDAQVKDRFDHLLPLTASTCGG